MGAKTRCKMGEEMIEEGTNHRFVIILLPLHE